METRRLEYFVTLVRERSFRRAADVLFISQPALSQQIQRLEQDLGVLLIDRSVQPFEVTPAGHRLLAQSRKILDEISAMEGVASGARRGIVGKVKVGVAPSLMYSAIPGMVRRFRVRFPDVELTMHRENTSSLLELIAEQRMDVGLVFSKHDGPSLECLSLYDDSFVVVLPADHPLARRGPVRMGDLSEEIFLMLMRRGVPDLHDAIIAACAEAGFSPRTVETNFQIEGAGYVDQIGLVAAGYGIAVIPAAVATLVLDSVVYRPVVKPSIVLPTSICWNREAREASIGTFVRFALEEFAVGDVRSSGVGTA